MMNLWTVFWGIHRIIVRTVLFLWIFLVNFSWHPSWSLLQHSGGTLEQYLGTVAANMCIEGVQYLPCSVDTMLSKNDLYLPSEILQCYRKYIDIGQVRNMLNFVKEKLIRRVHHLFWGGEDVSSPNYKYEFWIHNSMCHKSYYVGLGFLITHP